MPEIASAQPAVSVRNLRKSFGAHQVLRDISLSGLGLITTTAVPDNTRVRIQSQDFEAIAMIIGSQRDGGEHLLHARLLSLALTRRTGVFMSETA